jgi:alkylhydroperoxidase/carboxymuconolactone decarboxylase family protein YurZ
LRRLAVSDPGVLEALRGADPAAAAGRCRLDGKTVAFVELAALVALGAVPTSLQWAVANALAAGATDEEVVSVLVALAPMVGTVRLESAVPDVVLALGRDLDVSGCE